MKRLVLGIALSLVAAPVLASACPQAVHRAPSVAVAEPIMNQPPPPPEPIMPPPPPAIG